MFLYDKWCFMCNEVTPHNNNRCGKCASKELERIRADRRAKSLEDRVAELEARLDSMQTTYLKIY